MIVGVPKEMYPKERRVALVPAVIPNLKKAGLEVVIERGAGLAAGGSAGCGSMAAGSPADFCNCGEKFADGLDPQREGIQSGSFEGFGYRHLLVEGLTDNEVRPDGDDGFCVRLPERSHFWFCFCLGRPVAVIGDSRHSVAQSEGKKYLGKIG